MKKIFSGIMLCACLWACNDDKQTAIAGEVSPDSNAVTKPATEVLDLSEANDLKTSFAALAKGDVDGMLANYDENA